MIDLMQKAVEQARKDYGEACGGHEDWFIADACAKGGNEMRGYGNF